MLRTYGEIDRYLPMPMQRSSNCRLPWGLMGVTSSSVLVTSSPVNSLVAVTRSYVRLAAASTPYANASPGPPRI
jgi:hypothetical protein